MPLLEIVTEPDIRSADEAFAYVTSLRKLVRHLNVCDGNMEQGSLRCDVNISVRKKGEQKLGTKVEIKNLNSIRFIRKAIGFESKRLISLLEEGKVIVQETRGFDENNSTTYSIRVKEDEDDYRYFPEPDLPPFFISGEMIEKIRSEMPALQTEIKEKLIAGYQLSNYDAEQLSNDMELSNLFFELVRHSDNYKASANWILGPVKNHLSASEISLDEMKLNPAVLAEIIRSVDIGRISYGIAVQQIFPAVLENPSLNIDQFIKENQLQVQTSQTEIENLIEAALNKHPEKITEYKKGKKGLISLFVGEVMKLSKGKADAKLVTEKIIEKLKA
jgi:aspartyl-tRNA(Asn)/glutamyl-tRNA(Gln) amidotransferase subunit B